MNRVWHDIVQNTEVWQQLRTEWTDKQTGQKIEKTEWHRVVLLGKVAEMAGEYVRKGSQVYIEGKLKTREWEKDGIKRYTTEILVDMRGSMQLLGTKPDTGQSRVAPAQEATHSSFFEPEPCANGGTFDDAIPF